MKSKHLELTSWLIMILYILICCGCGLFRKKVRTVKKVVDGIQDIDITDGEKFLNDLMLSPYWKVEKDWKGSFKARARSISPEFGVFYKRTSSDMPLFEFIKNDASTIPEGHKITNKYMHGGKTYTSFSVNILFRKSPLKRYVNNYRKGEVIELDIYESIGREIGPNSFSQLQLRLSSSQGIYLILREQGSDSERKVTFDKLPKVIEEIERVQNLPDGYFCKDIYASFFNVVFDNLKSSENIKRKPGFQDRDTFYGYFKTRKNLSYNGINIKISHPVFCEGECTRPSSRIKKAEYLGTPYHNDDLVFFYIEDNAIYLKSQEYRQIYGTFSGNEDFEGDLQILNETGEILYKATDFFKGWER